MKRIGIYAAVVALAAGLGLGAAMAEGKIVISNWDGYMPKDLPEKFKQATGIEVEVALHATNEEIMGKVVAGKGRGYDVLFVSSPFAEVLHKLGLSATIDHAKVPNLANLYSEANTLAYDPGNTFSVPYAWGTTGLCYRSDLIAGEPASWMDLLQPADALKGKTTMLATDRWLLGAGFLATGASINETDPGKIEAAKQLLIAAKKTLLAYDDTTFYSKLVSGEALMVQAWDGWCNYGIAENAAIKYVIPKEGSDLWVDTMVVIEGSASKDAAHAFVNYVLNADVGNWVASNILYKVPNKAAMEALDKALIEQYPNLGMSPADLIKFEAMTDVGETQKLYSRTVSEITAAQ